MAHDENVEPAHYLHGPSSAHRWMHCPGSIQAEAQYPDDDAGDAADEGTAAHWLLEQCLLNDTSAADFKAVEGDVVPAGEETGCVKDWPITGEMIESVQSALDHVWSFSKKKGTMLWVEDRVRLDDTLGLPVPVGGTCDIRLYLPRSKVLMVLDFKYGRGHVVEVRGNDGKGVNEQLALYALGALYEFEKEFKGKREVKWVEVGIIQPRAYHKKGPIRTYKVPPEFFMDAEIKLIEAVEASIQPDAPRTPGEDQCRFCKHKRNCTEFAEWRGGQATGDFEAEVRKSDGEPGNTDIDSVVSAADIGSPAGPAGGVSQQVALPAEIQGLRLPHVPAMTLAQLGAVQPLLSYLKEWVAEVEKETRTRLLHDLKVPGKRLAPGRGSRPWLDEKAVAEKADRLILHNKFAKNDIYEPARLQSVAKIEKTIGRAKFKEHFGDLVGRIEGGPVVVDEDSDKPEYVKDCGFEAEEKFDPDSLL